MTTPLLDGPIAAEFRTLAERLDREGKLLSRTRLDDCYRLFRQRFGPGVLASLDGEDLLTTMHGRGTSDSLVYWLEFKKDDEFPDHFGSISGGSALKFGLFYSQDKKTWITGSPVNFEEITIPRAVEIVQRQRDELVAGARVLSEFAASEYDSDYAALQRDLENAAPSVQGSAWGHKYFSLLFPDKLDDFHNAEYARFHLIKLLQLPPVGQGRYLMGGRFVALKEQLGLPINHIAATMNERDGRKPCSYWRVGTRAGDSGPSQWQTMQQGNCIGIGWYELGDLALLVAIANSGQRKTKIKEILREHYGDTWYKGKEAVMGNVAAQIAAFLSEVAIHDVVVAMDGATVFGIGKVTGGYYYQATDAFPHQIPVDWLSHEQWPMSPPEQLRSTLRLLGKYPQHLVEIERRIYGKTPIIGARPPAAASNGATPQATAQTVAPPVPLTGIPAKIQAILERKSQVILYGPPGTGKTYWAEIAARELAARSWFGAAFGQLDDAQAAAIISAAVRLCSFHSAYGYEDFLEGYRPEIVVGQMTFQRRDGVFKRLCAEAASAPERAFYLVIDEINRGDIPRIFGELLTMLEANKRGRPITLPLSGEAFRVPSNVFVLGTMNTADRSIALLDAALRRRFGFLELLPDSKTLGEAAINGLALGPWLDAVNQGIVAQLGRDGRSLQIGHSYLLTGEGSPVTDFATFRRILAEDIFPLLQEYCYEDFAVLERILGPGLIDTKRQCLREELLGWDQGDELIDALIAPFPDLATLVPITDALADDEAAADEDLGVPEDEDGLGNDVLDPQVPPG